MSAKSRHVHLLVGEVNVLHAAMKRAQKWSQDDRNQLLEKVVTLKQILSSCEDLDQIDAKTFLLPFLDIIRAEDTSVVVTTLALTTVHKILTYRILDHRSKPEIASVVEQICKSVTRAQFTGSNPASDEGVLMKVLDVLKTLIISPPGNFLTNESVCEIVGSFSTMSLTPKLSMLLRTVSDTFLTEIIQHLFARLDREKLGEDTRDSAKRTMKKKLRNHILKRRAPVPPSQPSPPSEITQADAAAGVPVALDDKEQTPPPTESETHASAIETESVAETGESQTDTDSVMTTSESVFTEGTVTSAGDSEAVTPAPVSWSMGESAAPEDGDADDDLEEDGTEREVSEAETVDAREESVDERGIRFSSPLPKNDSTGAYIPYGLPAITEILWYIVTLIRSEERIDRNSEVEFELKLNLGLRLLGTVLETSAHVLAEHMTLMPLIKDELCRNLTFLLQNDRLSIFTLTLRLSFFVFESMKKSLKLQTEHFFLTLMEVISSESAKYTPEHKEAAIDLIVRLWRLPGFIAEMYLNYDCDFYSSDLYEDLVKLLSKNAFPVGNLTAVNVLALECLLIAVEKIDRHCQRALLDTLPRELPPAEHVMLQKHKVKKKLLINGTELFNKKPAKGIECLQEHGLLSDPLQPAEVAKFLRENSRLDKAMIGEFVSNKKNTPVLGAFVKSFDFAGKRIDEALREYLEAFRLPGESPLITHLMEHFAAHWQLTSGHPFLSNDSAFVMSYAIIMLNTSRHNETAKKQNVPNTVNDFKKQLSKLNKKDGAQTGEDFDPGLLEQIYHSIDHEEIVMPSERTGRVKDLYLWKMLLRRADKATYNTVVCGSFDAELFALLWGPTVSALSHAFDKTNDESIIRKTIGGFKKCAFIAASPRIMSCEIFDNIVVTLCKYSTLQNPTESISVLPVSFGQNAKAQLVTKTMFNLVHQHGDILRDGWKNIVECIVQLFRARLLPEYFYIGDDFGLQKTVSLFREDPVIPKQESGLFNSFFNFFDSGSRSTLSVQEETELKNIAKGCIEECKVSDLVIDSKFLQSESLRHFVDAVIVTGKNGQKPVQDTGSTNSLPERTASVINEDQAIVCLEVLVKVLIGNRDRLGEQGLKLWPVVHDYFFTTLLQENRSEMTFVSERAVVGLLRLAVRFLPRDHDKELQQEVLRSLKLLQGIRMEFFNRISRQITFALYDLFQANATAIKSAEDWNFLLPLLECAGAGLRSSMAKDKEPKPDSPAPVRSQPEVDSDRGYTSDPELYDNQSLSPAGSMTWLMVGKEGEIVETGSATDKNILMFPFEFVHHDKSAFFTAVESLRFLIKDTGRIVAENVPALVHCLCVFAEASVNGSAGINGRVQRAMLKKMDKRLQQKIQADRKALGRSRPVSTPVSPSDEDGSDYIKESLVLLDLMHTVHVRAFAVCRGMRIDLWTEVWCPLLRAMARLCCDYRKIVRTDGLTWLNRSLLIPDLQALSPQQWEECILKVMFPLLLALRSDGKQPSNMEETIIRAAPLVCKVFLQHLNSLLNLPTFGELWMSILDLLEQFLKSDVKSDLVKEAVLESIKNMLLVMSTAGVFQQYKNALWESTRAKVDSIVPGLIQQLLEITMAPPAERPVSIRPASPDPSAPVPFQSLNAETTSTSPPSSSLLLDPGILQGFPIPTLPLRNESKPSGSTRDDAALPPRTV